MRKTLLFLCLLCTKLAFAQLNDSFSDGDFTNSPTWLGSASSFQVIDGVLSTNGPQAASTLYLSTANSLVGNMAWEFYVNLGFDPSTTNYPRIYLISNMQDLSSTVGMQAYILQLGASGSAENFSFVRQNGSSLNTLLTLPDKTRSANSTVTARVRVERTAAGRWDFYTDFSGGRNFTYDGSVVDNAYTSSSFFGVYCRYSTASRYNLFKFDDFKIEPYVDRTAPSIVAVKSLNDNAFEVNFSEPVAPTSAGMASNYAIGGLGSPSTVEILGASSVKLSYASVVKSGTYTLSVSNVADLKGNVAANAANYNFIHVNAYTAQKGDVVINEIMAAPLATGTLNREYIELWNTTDKYIIITGWKYKDATSSAVSLPADTLAPKEYSILCAAADVEVFKPYGKTTELVSWPSLNNTGDNLTLLLPDNSTIIDAVAYSDAWYQSSSQKTGYALELINPNGPCGGAFNWTTSTAANNGTPGGQNSVYNPQHIDNVAPALLSVNILNNTTLQVDFSKAINEAMLTDVNNYYINNGIGTPSAAQLNSAAANSVILTLANPIMANVESLLTVSNLTNCAGIPIDASANTATILVTTPVAANEILISEVLFNPKTGGVDFVEIYNATNRILDLKELTISNPEGSTDSGKEKKAITATSVFIRPKTYWVLTTSPEVVQQHYHVQFPKQMVKLASMPAYNNASGTVKLWKDDVTIDEVSYNEKMHHALLKDVKGVSLERVSFKKGANEAGNFQSAAASSGFATPTAVNSQSETGSGKNTMKIAAKTFSPDNDGFEDLLQINYQFRQPGYLTTINIYTDKGVLVRKLARNISLSTQGTITWDGLDDGGQLCKVGLYVVKADVLSANGSADSFKQTCVLASKFN
jgi:hypothetical protein